MSSLCWFRTHHGPHKAIFSKNTHTRTHFLFVSSAVEEKNRRNDQLTADKVWNTCVILYCQGWFDQYWEEETSSNHGQGSTCCSSFHRNRHRSATRTSHTSKNKRRRPFVVNGFAQNTPQEYSVDDVCFIQ